MQKDQKELILSVAYVELCSGCGKHARLVIPSAGNKVFHFYSKDSGKEGVLENKELLSVDERTFLLDAIDGLDLPESFSHPALDFLVSWANDAGKSDIHDRLYDDLDESSPTEPKEYLM